MTYSRSINQFSKLIQNSLSTKLTLQSRPLANKPTCYSISISITAQNIIHFAITITAVESIEYQ